MNKRYKITAEVSFPEGVAAGAGSASNKQIIDRNGRGDYLLRGSALAGVLRSLYAESGKTEDEVVQWFGAGLDGEEESESMIVVSDAVIDAKFVTERTHNMVNRHTGAVAKGALFSIEALPPESKAVLSFTLKEGIGSEEAYQRFCGDIATILKNEPLVGGSSNRGIGRMVVNGDVRLEVFDLATVDGAADFMNREYQERKNGVKLAGEAIKVDEVSDKMVVNCLLGLPRGEDILVGDGQALDYALQPQRVKINGETYWRIPGSSLRGVFRAWMTRLAARDGASVRDSNERWMDQFHKDGQEYKPDLVAWGYDKENKKKYRKNPSLLEDPILDLFGSMYKRGRIHIADSFAREEGEAQDRMHVAVDRFSGGANEGSLFNNQVLVGNRLRFSVTLSIDRPTESEKEWLRKTLIALHLGILRVGSSKSGGRLEIKEISAKHFDISSIQRLMEETYGK